MANLGFAADGLTLRGPGGRALAHVCQLNARPKGGRAVAANLGFAADGLKLRGPGWPRSALY